MRNARIRGRVVAASMLALAVTACAPPGGGPVLTGTIGSYETQVHAVCTPVAARLRMVADHDAGARQVNPTLATALTGGTAIPMVEVSANVAARQRTMETPGVVPAGCIVVSLSAFAEIPPTPMNFTFTWF